MDESACAKVMCSTTVVVCKIGYDSVPDIFPCPAPNLVVMVITSLQCCPANDRHPSTIAEAKGLIVKLSPQVSVGGPHGSMNVKPVYRFG